MMLSKTKQQRVGGEGENNKPQQRLKGQSGIKQYTYVNFSFYVGIFHSQPNTPQLAVVPFLANSSVVYDVR